jgi:hypothetical protein
MSLRVDQSYINIQNTGLHKITSASLDQHQTLQMYYELVLVVTWLR